MLNSRCDFDSQSDVDFLKRFREFWICQTMSDVFWNWCSTVLSWSKLHCPIVQVLMEQLHQVGFRWKCCKPSVMAVSHLWVVSAVMAGPYGWNLWSPLFFSEDFSDGRMIVKTWSVSNIFKCCQGFDLIWFDPCFEVRQHQAHHPMGSEDLGYFLWCYNLVEYVVSVMLCEYKTLQEPFPFPITMRWSFLISASSHLTSRHITWHHMASLDICGSPRPPSEYSYSYSSPDLSSAC